MQLWTPEHAKTLLPAVLMMLAVTVLLRLTIGKKEHKIRMIPFQILTAVLFLLEIGKQAISLMKGYDLYHLPFHFCSLFIFMLPAMALWRGKHKQTVYGITAAISTATALLTLIYPSLIYSAWDVSNYFANYFAFHTVTFHNIVLLQCFLIIALRLHEPAPKGEHKAVVWFIVGFCLVSATMAQLLKTNFNNFYSCNIAPLEAVRLQLQASLGYGLTQALYIAIVTVLDIFFVLGSYWLYRGLRKLCAPKQTVSV